MKSNKIFFFGIFELSFVFFRPQGLSSSDFLKLLVERERLDALKTAQFWETSEKINRQQEEAKLRKEKQLRCKFHNFLIIKIYFKFFQTNRDSLSSSDYLKFLVERERFEEEKRAREVERALKLSNQWTNLWANDPIVSDFTRKALERSLNDTFSKPVSESSRFSSAPGGFKVAQNPYLPYVKNLYRPRS